MFSNKTQQKPPVPRRSKYNISPSGSLHQSSTVIGENKTETLISFAIGTLFVTPQGGPSTSASGSEQKVINYGTFSLRK
ncbi:MAG: hypothetical protein K0R48_550 [Gammaproteobacteria bacterium]|jgi:hypothetical protein|nr:hypothetical protein [Gammaproteobacteria bacterium]